jgi:diguanylate cyclase (GGDEF)-like protein
MAPLMGVELLFLLIPAIFLFGMTGFAVVAARQPDMPMPRWAALGFGFAVTAAVVDSMRAYWPPDIVMLSVPLHWSALAALMQAFLRRKTASPDASAIFMAILGFGIINVLVSRVHYLPDMRIAMVNGVAAIIVGHAAFRLRKERSTALDKTILGFVALVAALYLFRLGRYIGAGHGGDYGDLSVWSHYKIVAYFSASVLGLVAVLLLAIACGADLVARLRREQAIDALTGIPNRHAHDLCVMDDVRAADGLYDAAIMLDLDHFKDINDRFGHAGGDAALVAVAHQLQATLSRFGDVARIGGEEFAILLRKDGPLPAEALAERALHAIRAITLDPPFEAVSISASLGVATRLPGQSMIQTLRLADVALYEAKLGGRDRTVRARKPGQVLKSVA